MDLSVIIVNYRSAALILDCIASIFKYTHPESIEIIIVDNDSNDESEILLKTTYPTIKWIQMGYNAGFSRANNIGIKTAKHNHFLLLNPDTIILDNAIELCYNQFITSNNIACGVQLLNKDLSPQISGSYFMKGGLNYLLPLPYIGDLIKKIAFALKSKKPHILSASNLERVDWISGAFIMTNKTATENAGLLDEDFFLYAEEIEWCNRLGKYGKLYIYGNLKIIHLIGEVIKDATKNNDKKYNNIFDRKGLQLLVSNHLFIRKKFGVIWLLFHLLTYSLGAVIFLFIGLIHRSSNNGTSIKEHFTKAFQLFRNISKIWFLLPKMISRTPYFYKTF
jgi:GT2 family glycosyltransferase